VNESDEDMRKQPSYPIALMQCPSWLVAFHLTPLSACHDSPTHFVKVERGMKV